MDGWTDGRMDGWMVGWMNGWMDYPINGYMDIFQSSDKTSQTVWPTDG